MNPGSNEPGVGDVLRSRRLALGYDLQEVAVALRIRFAYLEAIEEGRFSDLPGATYVSGFLRTYAEHLGLDPQMVLRRFKEESSGALSAKPELYLPKPVPEGRIPGGALLLVAVLLAGAAYGGWYYVNSTGRDLVDLVPELPDRIATALNIAPAAPPPGLVVPVTPSEPGPAAPETRMAEAPPAAVAVPPPAAPAIQPPPSAATPQARLPAAAMPAPAPSSAPSSTATTAAEADEADEEESPIVESTPITAPNNDPRTAQASQQGAPPAAPPPAIPAPPMAPGQVAALPMPPAPPAAPEAGQGDTRIYGAINGQSRIQIRATQDSWIQVRDGTGDLLMTRVLRPGDVYRVPDQPGLRMVTGNAGGLMVSIDGGQGSALGGQGQVMRDVQLDPQRFAAGAR
ncbi:helix-turn-helix domain-containing protein [Skermanella pratensis]|uniref:helix-turn-helix domain-containing protein n=1 Tax=Skermanella pratensis TaxID=2233999 RepID=UPI00178827A2|nr:helix-turn-helix domain-containing protein [Skermanella pratensis]